MPRPSISPSRPGSSGVTAEDLLRAAVLDLIEGRDEAFLAAARHVIEKNAELYHRLS